MKKPKKQRSDNGLSQNNSAAGESSPQSSIGDLPLEKVMTSFSKDIDEALAIAAKKRDVVVSARKKARDTAAAAAEANAAAKQCEQLRATAAAEHNAACRSAIAALEKEISVPSEEELQKAETPPAALQPAKKP